MVEDRELSLVPCMVSVLRKGLETDRKQYHTPIGRSKFRVTLFAYISDPRHISLNNIVILYCLIFFHDPTINASTMVRSEL